MINVKLKRLNDDATIPQMATEGAAGFDLCITEPIRVAPGATELCKTGIAIELPKGYAALVCSRSGLAKDGLVVANAPALWIVITVAKWVF